MNLNRRLRDQKVTTEFACPDVSVRTGYPTFKKSCWWLIAHMLLFSNAFAIVYSHGHWCYGAILCERVCAKKDLHLGI